MIDALPLVAVASALLGQGDPLFFGEFNGTESFFGSRALGSCFYIETQKVRLCPLQRNYFGTWEKPATRGSITRNSESGRIYQITFAGLTGAPGLKELLTERYGQPSHDLVTYVWKFGAGASLGLFQYSSGGMVTITFPENRPSPLKPNF